MIIQALLSSAFRLVHDHSLLQGFPGGSDGNESASMQETRARSLGHEDPLEKGMVTHPIFLPEEFHRQRSLVCYSPWGWKELATTEQLTHILCLTFTWETEQKQISSVPGLGECLCSKGTNKFSWLLYFPFGTCGFYALNYDLNKTMY